MGVQVSVKGAPTEVRVCEWCADLRTRRHDVPAVDGAWLRSVDGDLSKVTESQWLRATCDPWCSSMRTVTLAPEVGWANANARQVLAALGLEMDGEISHEDIPDMLQKILRVLNIDQIVGRMVRAPSEELGALGCKVIDFGSDTDSFRTRLNDFRNLLIHAHFRGLSVTWG